MIKSSEISIVIQGPIYKNTTKRVCERMRQIFPQAEIIVSTWQGSDTSDLTYDILVESKDPGGTPLMLDGVSKKTNNVNRMIVSSKSGIKKATRKYTLRWRTDLLLKNDKFLDYFDKYTERNSEWKIFHKRVLVHYATLPYVYPLGPTDIACFGLTSDVLLYWDLPLQSDADATYFVNHPYPNDLLIRGQKVAPRRGAEMYVWYNVLKKFEAKYGKIPSRFGFDFNADILRLSELSIANNLQILTKKQFDFEPVEHNYLLACTKDVIFPSLWLYYYKKYCLERVPFYDLSYYIYYPCKLFMYKLKYIIPLRKCVKSLVRFRFDKAVSYYKIYKKLFYNQSN